MNPFHKGVLLIRELGVKQLLPFTTYQVRLRSGILRQITPAGGWKPIQDSLAARSSRVPLPRISGGFLEKLDRSTILEEADEILHGRYRPFGGPSAPLTLALSESPLEHWTHYGSTFAGQDIKFTWESARFGWAFPLVEAALLSGEDKYAACFWKNFDDFVLNNPMNLGPNWSSAQEAALRLLPILFARHTLDGFASTTAEHIEKLTHLVEQSARRISTTLDYARSQNNNHLLSESLGLIMAGAFFAGRHPLAERWERQGFREFERGLLAQIEPDGTYSQHSTHYHRLMLQLSLVYYVYAHFRNREVSHPLLERLAAATRWLLAQTDPISGEAPNLGHNDGTLLLPFGSSGYTDFRPTLQAASLAFLRQPAYASGSWDALALVLEIGEGTSAGIPAHENESSRSVHRVGNDRCWGTLRAVQFHSRPAHADQLTVELWWEGLNIAMDAGSYLYNAPAPWDNSLARTCIHNTISIEGQDQMLRAGRFLWLKRIDASLLPVQDENTQAAFITWQTDPPFQHSRSLTFHPEEGFTVLDNLTPASPMAKTLDADLQWLLPDWTFTLLNSGILLTREDRRIELVVAASSSTGEIIPELSLIRAGEVLAGDLQNPIRGWVSPTYGLKLPCLSLVMRIPLAKEIQVVSKWKLSSTPVKTG